VQVGRDLARVVVDRGLQRIDLLGVEAPVAGLIGGGGDVQAVGEQLDLGRGALVVGQAQAQEQAGGRTQEAGDRGRDVVEVALQLDRVAQRDGRDRMTVVAQAALEAELAEVETLDGIDPALLDVRGRDEGFLADGLEGARQALGADRAVPGSAADRTGALDQIDPAFLTVGVEDGAGLAGASNSVWVYSAWP
jgi:hypothetical protein